MTHEPKEPAPARGVPPAVAEADVRERMQKLAQRVLRQEDVFFAAEDGAMLARLVLDHDWDRAVRATPNAPPPVSASAREALLRLADVAEQTAAAQLAHTPEQLLADVEVLRALAAGGTPSVLGNALANWDAAPILLPAGAADRTRGAGEPDSGQLGQPWTDADVATLIQYGRDSDLAGVRAIGDALAQMKRERDELARECATLREDAARLDWLTETAAREAKIVGVAGVCYGSVYLGRKRIAEGDDIRDAIDAARAPARPAAPDVVPDNVRDTQ